MPYRLHYYDLVLIGVIVPVVLGVLIGFYTPVAPTTSILGLGAISIAVMAYALFVNGPVSEVEDLKEEVEELPGPMDDMLD